MTCVPRWDGVSGLQRMSTQRMSTQRVSTQAGDVATYHEN